MDDNEYLLLHYKIMNALLASEEIRQTMPDLWETAKKIREEGRLPEPEEPTQEEIEQYLEETARRQFGDAS